MKVKKLAKIVLIAIVFSGFYIQSMDGAGQGTYVERSPGNCAYGSGTCFK